MNRRTLAGLILLTWAGVIGWLGARELGRPSRPALSDDRTISPSAAFYAVSVSGVQLGFASTTVDTVPAGLVVDDRLVLELPAGDTTIRTDIRTVANLSNTMALQSFNASAGAPTGRFEIRGTISHDSALSITIVSETEGGTFELITHGPVVLANHVPVFLSSTGQLITGAAVELTAIDPLTLMLDSIRAEVGEDSTFFVPDSATYDSSSAMWRGARIDTVQAWRVRIVSADRQSELWVDRLGRLVSSRSASGPGLDRMAFELAFNNFRTRERGGQLARSVVLASALAARAGSPAGLASLSVVARGAGGISHETTLRQSWAGDTITVTIDPDSALQTSYRLPYDAAGLSAFLADELPYTVTDPFVQAQARQVIEGTANPRRATRRLVTWVSTELAKAIVPSVPAAIEVLRARQGDVTAHAILFIAMSRAAGIPARPVAGVILIDDTFYLHAWAEVYLGRAWVAADPTFGQFPAGAEYVRLIEGSGTIPALVNRLAQLDMDVVDKESNQ